MKEWTKPDYSWWSIKERDKYYTAIIKARNNNDRLLYVGLHYCRRAVN